MDDPNLPPGQETQPEIVSLLAQRLSEVNAIPPDPDVQYEEPVNDSGELGNRSYAASNEHTFAKIQHYAKPESGTAALAVGPTQGYQLLGMYPELTSLRIVDNGDAAVATARAFPELQLRIQQLIGRLPTAVEVIHVLRDSSTRVPYAKDGIWDVYTPPLVQQVLALPLATPGQQHTFSSDELKTIVHNRSEIAKDLERQLHNDWLQPEHLERIAAMYRNGQIQVHKGSIVGGKVMDHLRGQQPPFGLVYTSNIIQGGYIVLSQLAELTRSFEQLPYGEHPLFVQAIANVISHDGRNLWPHTHENWPYLISPGLRSFLQYLQPDNPDTAMALASANPITIEHYPRWSGRRFSLSQDGVITENSLE